MPKMKTHKGTAKRVKKTGSGKLKRSHSFRSHLLINKSQKQKRKLRKGTLVSSSDQKRINQMVTYL